MSSPIRITGMASGLDVDSIVKQMMTAEKVKVDKLTQNRQVVQWKQDLYREIMGSMNTFKSTYFDVLKPESYMLSTRNYSNFDITSTLAGTGTSAVTATATTGAVAGNYSVKVVNLAEKARVQGSSVINTEQAPNKIEFPIKITSDNDSLTVDGTSFDISQRVYNSLDELAYEINSKMAATVIAEGKLGDKVKAVVKNGKISFDEKIAIKTADPGKNNVFTIDLGNGDVFNNITIGTNGNYTLDDLAAQINNKLASSTAANNNKFDSNYKVSMRETTDSGGVKIQKMVVQKKDISGNYVDVGGSSSGEYMGGSDVTTNFASVTSETPAPLGSAQPTVSEPETNDNKLSYKQAFIKDVNDTIYVSIGGSAPIAVGLFGVDVSSEDNDIITNNVVSFLNNSSVKNDLSVSKSTDGKLIFKAATSSQITITGNGATTLGLGNNFTIDQTADDKMSNILSGKSRFTINGTTFYYDFDSTTDADTDYGKIVGAKNKSIRDIMTDISSKANVDISYSQLTRQFTMTSKNTGADEAIIAVDNGVEGTTGNKFLSTLFGLTNGINMGDAPLAEKYQFNVAALNSGDSINLTTIGPDPTENYTVTGTDVKSKAADLINQINNSSLSKYTAAADNNGVITLTQKAASSTATLSSVSTTDSSNVTNNMAFIINTAYTDKSLLPGSPAPDGSPIRKGEDAIVQITEPNSSMVTVNKNTNSFSIDGVNYTLSSQTTDNVTINLTSNPQKSFDKIKAFVDKYNEIIDKINTKLFEKKQYSYKPLTDDQKKDMKDDEIKAWEDKAKEGLLSNDSTLSNMLYSMRSAFYEPVKSTYSDSGNIGISMSDIGITTSSDFSQRGKLIIDETKLKDALQNKGDKVMQLFTKTSTAVPSYSASSSTTDRDHRYKELGLFQRISDILQDNLRTIRDNSGRKGILLEKAGIKGDLSEFHNILTDDLTSRDKMIKEMTSKLADKENKYYLQFSKLETAMQKLNSQSSWLSQQLSSSNG